MNTECCRWVCVSTGVIACTVMTQTSSYMNWVLKKKKSCFASRLEWQCCSTNIQMNVMLWKKLYMIPCFQYVIALNHIMCFCHTLKNKIFSLTQMHIYVFLHSFQWTQVVLSLCLWGGWCAYKTTQNRNPSGRWQKGNKQTKDRQRCTTPSIWKHPVSQ